MKPSVVRVTSTYPFLPFGDDLPQGHGRTVSTSKPKTAAKKKCRSDKTDAGRSVIDKLLKLRRSLTADESAYITQINDCIEEIRAFSRLDDAKLRERILFAIEKQAAHTLTEIIDETRTTPERVKAAMKQLNDDGLVYAVRRFIPGCGKPNFLYKSRRVPDNVEAV